MWLPSPALAVLQLRVPGRTTLAIVDARLALAALVATRPTATEATPKSQATLRAALEGGTLISARFETAADSRADDSAAVRALCEALAIELAEIATNRHRGDPELLLEVGDGAAATGL